MAWTAVCLLAFGWYILTAFYLPTNIHYSIPIWLGTCGIVLAGILIIPSVPVLDVGMDVRAHMPLLLSSTFFIIVVPFPYDMPAIVVGIGAFTALAATLAKRQKYINMASKVSSAALVSGFIMAIQSAVLPLFVLIASRVHRLEWLSSAMALIFSLVGYDVSSQGGDVAVQGATRVYTFITSLEGLGFFLIVNILIGGYVVLVLSNSSRLQLILFPLILLGYFIFRHLGLMIAYVEFERVNVFWRLDFLVASLVPLPFLLGRFLGTSKDPAGKLKDRGWAVGTPRVWAYYISLASALAAFVCFFGFVDPGVKKAGRVLIDEGHSNWEWTTEKFDKSTYGERTTYNYWCLADYLANFYHVEKKKIPLTEDVLSKFDILFIKTPTEAFAEGEILAIKKFVENGGGLFLVGDHTNVFGITTNLNPVASQFGVTYRYDGQYDLGGELSLFERPLVLPHPIVRRMPKFMFATGCMLDAPITAENVITGYGVKSVALDYSRPNFFPADATNTERTEFGLFVQAAGITYGRGRVFLFTDSTVWSNFYMFIPGKPEVLLGAMEWLNRTNSAFAIVRGLSIFVGVLAFAVAIIFAWKLGGVVSMRGALVTAFVVLPAMFLGLEFLNGRSYSLPVEQKKTVRINFENEHSDAEFPEFHITQNQDRSYHTFFVWTQRIGVVPQLFHSVEEAAQGGEAVVLVNPIKLFSKEEAELLQRYVRQGGKLFILNDPNRRGPEAASLLLAALGSGLRISKGSAAAVSMVRNEKDTLLVKSTSCGVVQGGSPILFARKRIPDESESRSRMPMSGSHEHFEIEQEQIRARSVPAGPSPIMGFPRGAMRGRAASVDTVSLMPVMATENMGKGMIVVLASSALFTDREMGYTTTQPNQVQRKICELEYWILEEILSLKTNQ